MSEQAKNPEKTKTTERYLKIITTDDHDIDRVNRILLRMDPACFILESKNRMNNLKTLHIAQTLRKNGCKDVQMKFYKGEVLKIKFIRNRNKQSNAQQKTAAAPTTAPVCAAAGSHYIPQRPVYGTGDLMSDIDHKTVG